MERFRTARTSFSLSPAKMSLSRLKKSCSEMVEASDLLSNLSSGRSLEANALTLCKVFKIQDSRRNFLNQNHPFRLPSSRPKAWDSKSFPQNLESWILNPENFAKFAKFSVSKLWELWYVYLYIYILKCVHVCMGTGELNESKHINKPVPGGTVIPQYPYIYIHLSIYLLSIYLI